MNGIHVNGKAHKCEKQIPGCLGRVANLFDFASYSAGNRLLTEKAHRDGSPPSRSRSDVSRIPSTSHEIGYKVMVSESLRSSSCKKADATPVRMLMSTDLESRNHPPTVVGKLMGLDTLPQPQVLDLAPDVSQSHSRNHSHSCDSETSAILWRQENNVLNRDANCQIHDFQVQNECKDVRETWLQPQLTNYLCDTLPQKARYRENANEKKMSLIRQKFTELKCLAVDEKCHQSKDFQDALEALNIHRDLYVERLHEQNPVLSQHLCMRHSIHPPQETKRITVLRPSKLVLEDKFCASGQNIEKQIKEASKVDLADVWEKHRNGLSLTIPTTESDHSSIQSTRIVVLKSNPGIVQDFRAATTSAPPSPMNVRLQPDTSLTSKSPRNSDDEWSVQQSEREAREAREVARDITQQMHTNLASLRRDETLLCSVFSDGHIGVESSSNKSEAEFVTGNLNGSEALSSTSRHSWDYARKYESPYPYLSINRAPSSSPESSVSREAKKRLSERWAMMSGQSKQEKAVMQRESSTLGEMLSLFDVQKPEIFGHAKFTNIEGPRGSTSCIDRKMDNEECIDESPRSLLRSKSLPASTAYRNGMTIEGSDPGVCKTGYKKDAEKMKTVKLSFAGKVTSLFLSRVKKSSKEKPIKYQSEDESANEPAISPAPSAFPGRTAHDELKKNIDSEEGVVPGLKSPMCSLSPMLDTWSAGVTLQQMGLGITKPSTHGLPGDNPDQPSPISVLDLPFEEDDNILWSSSSIRLSQGERFPSGLGPSNLIDKSPHIGSVARTLWDERHAERESCCPSKSPSSPLGAMEEEGGWLFLVQSLLSAAGLEKASQFSSNIDRWHSPESPLDPFLRENYVDMNNKELLHEAKRRHVRLNQKLVFDFVNVALVNILGIRSSGILFSQSCFRSDDFRLLDHNGMPLLADRLWALMKECFAGGVRCLGGDIGDDEVGSSLVEMIVWKEVVGKGWANDLRSEIDNFGKEIEGRLLEELVVESLVELTGKRC